MAPSLTWVGKPPSRSMNSAAVADNTAAATSTSVVPTTTTAATATATATAADLGVAVRSASTPNPKKRSNSNANSHNKGNDDTAEKISPDDATTPIPVLLAGNLYYTCRKKIRRQTLHGEWSYSDNALHQRFTLTRIIPARETLEDLPKDGVFEGSFNLERHRVIVESGVKLTFKKKGKEGEFSVSGTGANELGMFELFGSVKKRRDVGWAKTNGDEEGVDPTYKYKVLVQKWYVGPPPAPVVPAAKKSGEGEKDKESNAIKKFSSNASRQDGNWKLDAKLTKPVSAASPVANTDQRKGPPPSSPNPTAMAPSKGATNDLLSEKSASNNNSHNHPMSEEEKKRKECYGIPYGLFFSRVLMAYLEQCDTEMHAKAKSVMNECYEKNKAGHPEFKCLGNALKPRLRATVGEVYWKEADDFLLFVRVLMTYLEQRDTKMQAKAHAQIKECYEKNKAGHPEFKSLTNAMRLRLRATVGEVYWKNAHIYLDHTLKQWRESKSGQQAPHLTREYPPPLRSVTSAAAAAVTAAQTLASGSPAAAAADLGMGAHSASKGCENQKQGQLKEATTLSPHQTTQVMLSTLKDGDSHSSNSTQLLSNKSTQRVAKESTTDAEEGSIEKRGHKRKAGGDRNTLNKSKHAKKSKRTMLKAVATKPTARDNGETTCNPPSKASCSPNRDKAVVKNVKEGQTSPPCSRQALHKDTAQGSKGDANEAAMNALMKSKPEEHELAPIDSAKGQEIEGTATKAILSPGADKAVAGATTLQQKNVGGFNGGTKKSLQVPESIGLVHVPAGTHRSTDRGSTNIGKSAYSQEEQSSSKLSSHVSDEEMSDDDGASTAGHSAYASPVNYFPLYTKITDKLESTDELESKFYHHMDKYMDEKRASLSASDVAKVEEMVGEFEISMEHLVLARSQHNERRISYFEGCIEDYFEKKKEHFPLAGNLPRSA